MSKKSALHINKGTSDAPYINPKWKGSTRSEFDVESLCNLVFKGGKVLTGLARRINRDLVASAINEVEDVEAFIESLT